MATVGRPKREEWEMIRARAWANAARTILRQSPDQIHLSPKEIDRWLTNLKRYERGEFSPRISMIKQLEAIAPGAQQYFTSPLWKLTYAPTIGKRETRELFADLPASFQTSWLEPKSQTRLFWRKERSVVHELEDVKTAFQLPTTRLDALCLIAILLHEAATNQNRQRFISWFAVWAAYVQHLYDGYTSLPSISLAGPTLDWLVHFASRIAQAIPPGAELDSFQAWRRERYIAPAKFS